MYLKIAYENFSVSIQENELKDPLSDALFKMCNDQKFTLLHYELTQEIINEMPELKGCEIIKIPSPVYSGWATITFRHASPYLKIFNRM